MPQFFKGDVEELKYYNSGNPEMTVLSGEKTDFFNDAYNCYILGEIIWDSGRSPLANAIPRDIFRTSFSALYDSFILAGSFESYLSVFRQVFGDDVTVVFTVPAPGKLEIDIEAEGIELSAFIARRIVSNAYVYDQVVTQDGDRIVFQSVKGLESEYELNQMLYEMVPGGVFTDITLTIGGS